MLSLEVVVTSAKFPPVSVVRLDVDLTEEQVVGAVRAVTQASVSAKDAFVGVWMLVRKMPGGSNVAEIHKEPLVGADLTVVAEYNGQFWDYRIHRPCLV
jgi:hypothetical protein